MVIVLPVFLSRTVIVPAPSSVLTTSTSGLIVATSLLTARPGLRLISSGSRPACRALWTTKYPAPSTATAPSTNRPSTATSTQTMGLVLRATGAIATGPAWDVSGDTGVGVTGGVTAPAGCPP